MTSYWKIIRIQRCETSRSRWSRGQNPSIPGLGLRRVNSCNVYINIACIKVDCHPFVSRGIRLSISFFSCAMGLKLCVSSRQWCWSRDVSCLVARPSGNRTCLLIYLQTLRVKLVINLGSVVRSYDRHSALILIKPTNI